MQRARVNKQAMQRARDAHLLNDLRRLARQQRRRRPTAASADGAAAIPPQRLAHQPELLPSRVQALGRRAAAAGAGERGLCLLEKKVAGCIAAALTLRGAPSAFCRRACVGAASAAPHLQQQAPHASPDGARCAVQLAVAAAAGHPLACATAAVCRCCQRRRCRRRTVVAVVDGGSVGAHVGRVEHGVPPTQRAQQRRCQRAP